MNNYLLKSEIDKIDNIINSLAKALNTKEEELLSIKYKLYLIISKGKDSSIEDIINIFTNMLIEEIRPILDTKLSPGLQVGIKNNYFNINTYGGKYNINEQSREIDNNTMFSFDSISKLLTSTITMLETKNNGINLNTKVNELNKEYNLNSSIESILKFTALIRTEKRIENLSKEETITILKRCKENIKEKSNYKNFYEYNDIGYMILRQSIDNFLNKLNNLLLYIDKNNLTYDNISNKDNITGGRIGEEYITPDRKGREIIYPGHTGLYGNIEGLLNMFYEIMYTNNILDKNDKYILFRQPYIDPTVYNSDGTPKTGKNGSLQYMSKVAGIYRKPICTDNYQFKKLSSCDMSEKTTYKGAASAGTAGSWVTGDNLEYNNKFGTYISGLLSNPYSSVENKTYPNKINNIENTSLQINSNGIILGYASILNRYKNIITDYSLLLEVLTEYIKEIDKEALEKANKKLIKKIV